MFEQMLLKVIALFLPPRYALSKWEGLREDRWTRAHGIATHKGDVCEGPK
jgi:hypothetical protein